MAHGVYIKSNLQDAPTQITNGNCYEYRT